MSMGDRLHSVIASKGYATKYEVLFGQFHMSTWAWKNKLNTELNLLCPKQSIVTIFKWSNVGQQQENT